MSIASTRAPFSCFVDRTMEPDLASVRKVLADARGAWDELEAHLEETYTLKGKFHFMYGERYGWAFRFDRGGRLAMAMYPNKGYLTVQIILGRAQVEMATAMILSRRIVKVLEAATDYPEGRWLFIPLQTVSGARELRSLIALKLSKPPKNRSSGRTT